MQVFFACPFCPVALAILSCEKFIQAKRIYYAYIVSRQMLFNVCTAAAIGTAVADQAAAA